MHVEAQPHATGGNAKLVVKGKDLTCVSTSPRLAGVPYPAHLHRRALGILCRRYAAFGVIPQVIPAVVDEPPLPTEQHPAAQGHGLPIRASSLAQEAGYVFYLEPGPTPGPLDGVLGPGRIRIGSAAACTIGRHGRADQRRPDYRSTSTGKPSIPVVFLVEPQSHLTSAYRFRTSRR